MAEQTPTVSSRRRETGRLLLRSYFSITAAQKHSATSCSRRYLPTVRVYLRLTVKSRKNRKSCDNSRPDDTFHVRAVFIVKNAVFSKSKPEKTPEKCPYCVTGAQKGVCMRQGLPSRKRPPIFGLTRKTPYPYPHPQHRLEKASACIQPPLSGDLPAD